MTKPVVQWYAGDKEARVFDGGVTITISGALRRAAIAPILRRFSYRVARWRATDWGHQAALKKGPR